jgi:hypothetical protein
MNPGRRQKVKKDLERAGPHEPSDWFLVVPIDPTPGEMAWFDRLRDTVPFPIRWLGRNWLDARMAEHPFLVRYLDSDTNAKVIALLRDLRDEEAALETAADAVPRINRVIDQLNELDPSFTFEVQSDAQGTRLTSIPRYADAALDAGLEGTFKVSGEEAGDLLRESIDFGSPVEFTAEHAVTVSMRGPAGLDYEGPAERLLLLPIGSEIELQGVLRVVDGASTIAEMPVTIERKTLGRRGGVLNGRDRAGVLTFELRFDNVEKTATMNSTTSVPPSALPGDFLPALTFMRAAETGMKVALAVAGTDGVLRQVFEMTMAEQWFPFPEAIDLLAALDRIQRASGQYFELGEGLTPADRFWIEAADRLLAGEAVDIPWTEQTLGIMIVPEGREGILRSLEQGENRVQLRIRQKVIVPIANRKIRVGAGETQIHGAVVANAEEVRAAVKAAPLGELVPVDLKLLPIEGVLMTVRLDQGSDPEDHD